MVGVYRNAVEVCTTGKGLVANLRQGCGEIKLRQALALLEGTAADGLDR